MTRARRATVLLLGISLAFLLVLLVATREPPASDPDVVPDAGEAPREQGPPAYVVLGPEEEPVAGAAVELHAAAPWRIGTARRGETVTGSDGGIRGLPETPPGESPVLVVRADGLPPSVFRPEPGERELYLTHGRPVSGAVLDLHGRPLPGARILHPKEPPFLLEATAGPDGRFDLGPLPGTETIRVEAEARAPLDLELGLFPDEPDSIVATLAPGHVVEGRVVDTRGEPVEGVVVWLEQESDSRVFTDGEGAFRFDGVLPDWEVLLTPLAEERVGETVVADCDQRDVKLVLSRPAEVRGVVVDGRTGFPLPGARVLRPRNARMEEEAFRIVGLLPGVVRISAQAGYLSGDVTVNVAEGEVVEDVKLPLFPARWVPPRGSRAAWPLALRVLDRKTREPVAGLRVFHPETGNAAETDEDGRLVALLPAGPCRFIVGGAVRTHRRYERTLSIPREGEVEILADENPLVTVIAEGDGEGEDGRLWIATERGREVKAVPVERGLATFPASPGERVSLRLEVDGCFPGHRVGVSVPEDLAFLIPLRRGAYITARALESSGRPLARVGIEVADMPAESRVESAGDGVLRIGPVRPGRHRILLNARNVRTRRFEVDVPSEGLDLGDITMRGPCRLDVLVLTSAGEPIPGAHVTTTYRVAAKGLTDGAGRITLPGTEAEELLRAEAEGYLDGWRTVRVGEETERLDVEFRLLRPARLLVRTVDAGGRPVLALDPGREDLDSDVLRPGELLLTNLRPGEIEVAFESEDGRRGSLRAVLSEGEERTVTVVLE